MGMYLSGLFAVFKGVGMSEQEFPAAVAQALTSAAELLGKALLRLHYPNGGRDAVFAETNLLMYAGHGLLSCEKPFHCYAEAAHTNGRRIDMVAFDGDCAVAIEAKKFGNIGYVSESILRDLERLSDFRPIQSSTSDGSPAEEWWQQASQRWGLLLVGSHAGDSVKDAWTAQSRAEASSTLEARTSESTRRRATTVERENATFMNLLDTLDRQKCGIRKAISICPGSGWDRCNDAYLLWAGFRLP